MSTITRTKSGRVPFSRRHPVAYLAMWAGGVLLIAVALGGHFF